MHLIYGGAIITIIAVSSNQNDFTESRLYKISLKRNYQPYIHYTARTFILILPYLSYHISRLKWVTRG
jgi:hypothetical protein